MALGCWQCTAKRMKTTCPFAELSHSISGSVGTNTLIYAPSVCTNKANQNFILMPRIPNKIPSKFAQYVVKHISKNLNVNKKTNIKTKQ